MLFNSLSFAVFLPLVFGLYWLIASPKDDGFVSPTRLNLQNLFGRTYPLTWKHLSLFPMPTSALVREILLNPNHDFWMCATTAADSIDFAARLRGWTPAERAYHLGKEANTRATASASSSRRASAIRPAGARGSTRWSST